MGKSYELHNSPIPPMAEISEFSYCLKNFCACSSKAEEVDAHDNVASPQHDLEPLTTQASLEDWRKKPAAKQALQEQDEL